MGISLLQKELLEMKLIFLKTHTKCEIIIFEVLSFNGNSIKYLRKAMSKAGARSITIEIINPNIKTPTYVNEYRVIGYVQDKEKFISKVNKIFENDRNYNVGEIM